jgi:hypothetical protein
VYGLPGCSYSPRVLPSSWFVLDLNLPNRNRGICATVVLWPHRVPTTRSGKERRLHDDGRALCLLNSCQLPAATTHLRTNCSNIEVAWWYTPWSYVTARSGGGGGIDNQKKRGAILSRQRYWCCWGMHACRPYRTVT